MYIGCKRIKFEFLIPAVHNITQEVPGKTNPLFSFHYKLWAGLSMDHIENTMSNSSTTVARVFVAMGTCLLSSCLATSISSGFQASCHTAPSSRLLSNSRGCNVGITDGRNS
jgi:hypothetical protein